MLTEKTKTRRFKHFVNATVMTVLLLLTFAGLTAAQSIDSGRLTENLTAKTEILRRVINKLSDARSLRASVNVTNSSGAQCKYLLEYAAPDRLRISVVDYKDDASNIVGLYEAIEVGGKAFVKEKSDSVWEKSEKSFIKRIVQMRNEILIDTLLKGVEEKSSGIKVYNPESKNGDILIYETTIKPTEEKHGLELRFRVDRTGNFPSRLEIAETGLIGEELFWDKLEIEFYDFGADIEIASPM
jgi:hypothetical protein